MNARIDPADETEPTEAAAEDAAASVQASADQAAEHAAEQSGTATADVTEGVTGAAASSSTGEAAPVPVQTVYVTAPQPPRRKGNRGLGTVLAILAAVVFAAAYAGVTALLILFVNPDGLGGAVGEFVSGPLFYVPVLVFLVAMVLWVLLANRASWWAWVLGSLVIAAVVYFATIGVLLLLAGGFGLTGSQAADLFRGFALNPAVVVAALLAREVSVWFGAAIAARGRKVRERNYEAWQEFERDEAEKRAEFAGQSAV
ncbi:hypothetical protein GCM10022239_05260 [Leifsonia bigeumensis]|uniref:ABC transporter n=1 Tax=Leifsonella bigeumensis TaxID=433643 RepID=A0ABP7FAM2_9MICO